MVKTYNPSIFERFVQYFNVKGDNVSTEIEDKIRPVVILNPRLIRSVDITKTTTGGTTIYSAPLDKDTYLVGCNFSFSKTAACDCTAVSIRITPDKGAANTNLISTVTTTLTATNGDQSYSYVPLFPIKLSRGSTINCLATFTVGAMQIQASAQFFNEEVTK